jgi:hypothetical protein
MMGHQLGERHVPSDHLLRSIDRFVELDGLRRKLSAFYSTIGRPAGRLLLRHPFGAALVRRGSPQSGIPLVLPPWARW